MRIVATEFDSVPATSEPDWRAEMGRAIRDAETLCRILDLPAQAAAAAQGGARDFPIFAPYPYVEKMRKGDPSDPLLRQILPIAEESNSEPGFVKDPLQERQATVVPGLLQKYDRRALLVVTGACAVHCRYCFRRHFPYGDGPPRAVRLEAAIEKIRDDASIDEVILSGGDPLTLGDDELAWIASRIRSIPHVRRLRVHTRLPIVIPPRVTESLMEWLARGDTANVVVVHTNHVNELQGDVLDALRRMTDRGLVVLNQAVLLKGINDSVEAQESLCRQLINHRVTPYYLHQMDRVAGAAHFQLAESVGREIVSELRGRLPGYGVPRFVVEEPGRPGKSVLA